MQPLGSPYWGHRSITSQVEMEEEEDEAEAMDTAGWTCSLVDVFFPVCFLDILPSKKRRVPMDISLEPILFDMALV